MKTQTALYTWTAPDGTPRYLIDHAEWRDGQTWTRTPGGSLNSSVRPSPALGPVWVRELLPIPEPLPEVHWIDGHPVAMRGALPANTTYKTRQSGLTLLWDEKGFDVLPVIVVSWPDGSKPAPPTVDGAR